ncbi:MAG: BamA/TamA family outer membrane protein [Flavobacterium sp.]
MKNKISLPKFLIIFIIFTTNSITAQNLFKRYVNYLVNNKSDLEQPQLLVYPTLAYAPETTWEIGFSSLYVYYAKRDTINRLSEINAFTFFTLENQYGLWFDHAIYTDKDRWFLLGKLRFQSFPLYFHGIGNNSTEKYTARVEANQVLIKERVLKKLKKNLFLGLEIDYQKLSSVDFILAEPTNINFQYPLGQQGSTNLGLGIGLVQDNRHNVLNVRDGFFSELAFLHSNTAWGSTYNFTSIFSDTRIYKPIGKKNVLAAQLLGQFNFGDVPFNQLSLLGGESMMRGYYFGRYRDNNQLAAQVEYRFLPIPFSFTNRIGAVAFASTGTVFKEANEITVPNLKFSAGAGLRFLLFPKKDIWTRIDYAFTKEGGGFYILIGESF